MLGFFIAGLIANFVISGSIIAIISFFANSKKEMSPILKRSYYLYAIIQPIVLLILLLKKIINFPEWENLGQAAPVFVFFSLGSLIFGIWLLINIPKTKMKEKLLLSLTFGIPVMIILSFMADGGF